MVLFLGFYEVPRNKSISTVWKRCGTIAPLIFTVIVMDWPPEAPAERWVCSSRFPGPVCSLYAPWQKALFPLRFLPMETITM